MTESLSQRLDDMGMLAYVDSLAEAGLHNTADLSAVRTPTDLPDEIPLFTRRKLAAHASGVGTAPPPSEGGSTKLSDAFAGEDALWEVLCSLGLQQFQRPLERC